ncbi:MAG: hypothetical protein HC842_03120 [Cytophagales bacterium]|nr:hypothetical protein [Cytophagales bacterium]
MTSQGQGSLSFSALPKAYYTPETRLAVGGLALAYFRLAPADSASRLSSTELHLTYTQNQQFLGHLFWRLFASGERWLWEGDLLHEDFTEFFFGLGPSVSYEGRELYRFRESSLVHSIYRRIAPNTFIGLVHYLRMANFIQFGLETAFGAGDYSRRHGPPDAGTGACFSLR